MLGAIAVLTGVALLAKTAAEQSLATTPGTPGRCS
jgi:hypothetical protein